MNEPNLTHLTVREVADALKQRDVGLSYSSLSELLNTGDIAEQLRIEGGGNARKILPDVVDILANFWPVYKQNRGRLPQAPDMLRSFLHRSEPGALVPTAPPVPAVAVRQIAQTPNPVELAEAQGRAQGLAMTE